MILSKPRTLMYNYFFLPVFLLVFASCSNEGNTPQNDSAKADSPAAAGQRDTTFSDWHSLTESWNASLNLKNASIMKSFYADTVLYYGDRISSTDVVTRQQNYFNANADYRQKIVDYMDEAQQPDGSWRIRIVKQVRAGGKTVNYPASLTFNKQNGIWKIIAESDDITDITKARAQEVQYSKEVELTGLLEQTTGYPDVKGGDPKSERETYFIFWPSSPLDVSGGNDPQEKNVDRLQVIGDAAMLNPVLNKKVKITATPAHQNGPHQYTKVVLNAKSVEEVK